MQTSSVKSNKQEEEKIVITPRQSGALLTSTLLGVGVLTLPRAMAEAAQEAAWLATIFGGLVALLFMVTWTRLSFRFPLKTLANYMPEILGSKTEKNLIGKALATPIILVILSFWLFSIALIIRSFGEVVVTSVLTHTPLEVIIISMLVLAYGLTLYEVEVVARVNELVLPLILIPAVLMILFSLQSIKLEFILPLWPDIHLRDFLYGIVLASFAYQGYEVLSAFGGYTFVTKHTLPANMIGILLPLIIYATVVTIAVGTFGTDELPLILWPTFELVKMTEVPGIILERMESAFLSVWVAAVFTTAANMLYVIAFMTRKFVSRGKTHIYALISLPLIYWLALLPDNVHTLFIWQSYSGYFGVFLGGTLPLLLLIIARLRNIGQPPDGRGSNTSQAKSELSS